MIYDALSFVVACACLVLVLVGLAELGKRWADSRENETPELGAAARPPTHATLWEDYRGWLRGGYAARPWSQAFLEREARRLLRLAYEPPDAWTRDPLGRWVARCPGCGGVDVWELDVLPDGETAQNTGCSYPLRREDRDEFWWAWWRRVGVEADASMRCGRGAGGTARTLCVACCLEQPGRYAPEVVAACCGECRMGCTHRHAREELSRLKRFARARERGEREALEGALHRVEA